MRHHSRPSVAAGVNIRQGAYLQCHDRFSLFTIRYCYVRGVGSGRAVGPADGYPGCAVPKLFAAPPGGPRSLGSWPESAAGDHRRSPGRPFRRRRGMVIDPRSPRRPAQRVDIRPRLAHRPPPGPGSRLAATALARRPCDLRHAALSLWLNAGAPPAQIAACAGHSVTVLLTVYAHCIDGQDQITNRLIEHALRPASPALCPKASGSANRRYRPHPVRYMSVRAGIQAAHRTDSHGHCPQNRLTCANQQAEPCAPKRIRPGRMCAEARQANHSAAVVITRTRDIGS